MQPGGRADFLRPFIIWSHASGLMPFCDGSKKGTASMHQILCNSQKKYDRDAGND
jgi:hypothetical protein